MNDLLLAKQSRRIAEAHPMGMDRQHSKADPKLPCDNAEQLAIAAMGVDEDRLANACPVHSLANLNPGIEDSLGRKCERPRPFQMLVRFADRLDRQEDGIEVRRDP